MKKVLLSIAVVLAGGHAGCSCGDNQSQNQPPDGHLFDAPPDTSLPPTFTSFVIDQIKNHTANNTDPVPFATFATLPDPDSNNGSAYSSLFP